MALSKNFKTKSGNTVTGAYLMIMSVMYNNNSPTEQFMNVTVGVFNSEAEWIAKTAPIEMRNYRLADLTDKALGSIFGLLEAQLKALPDFSGAIAV